MDVGWTNEMKPKAHKLKYGTIGDGIGASTGKYKALTVVSHGSGPICHDQTNEF